MDSGSEARRGVERRRQQVLRRRARAGAGVLVCIVADIWTVTDVGTVAAAGAREAHPERSAASWESLAPGAHPTTPHATVTAPARSTSGVTQTDPSSRDSDTETAPSAATLAADRAAASAVVPHGTTLSTTVATALEDSRGCQGKDGVRFVNVSPEQVCHGIGHPHAYCGDTGEVAPIMMQQSYGLKGCTAWPWPTARPA